MHSIASPSQEALRALCDRASQALLTLPPRCIQVHGCRDIVHIWTDGSWEGGVGGLGAVFYDAASGRGRVFQGCAPQLALETWRGDVGDHLICQIELFAVLGVRMHLRQELRQRRVIFWIDNESARLCLVRGYSKSRSMDCLMRAYAQLEDKEPCFAWYARVPSHSNIADAPSRFEGEQVLGLAGAKAVEPFPVIPN